MATTKITSNLVADDAITLAKMAGGTDGQILTYDASGNPVAVGPGTDGQVLTSTGAGSPPAFENAGGGGGNWTEASSGTFSTVSTLNFTSISETTKIVLTEVTKSTSSGLRMRTSTDGGSSYDSSAGNYSIVNAALEGNDSAIALTTSAAGLTAVQMEDIDAGLGNSSTDDITIEIVLWNPEDTARYTMWSFDLWGVSDESAAIARCWGTGARVSAANVDAFQIYPSGGTITGNYKTYTIS